MTCFVSLLLLGAGRTVTQSFGSTTEYWNGGDGNWSAPNWLLNGGGSPVSWLDGSGASLGGNYTLTVDRNVSAAQIDLSAGTIVQAGHNLVAQGLMIGEYGSGTLNLSGGSLDASSGYGFTCLGIYGTGNVNVTGGTLNTSYLSVGYNNGTGNVNVSAGKVGASTLEIGGLAGVGNVLVSGGAVAANSLTVGNMGSIGTVSVSSGSLSVSGPITLGQQGGIGIFQHAAGNLTANALQVNGLGVFIANDTGGPAASTFTSLGCGSAGTFVVVPYNGHLDSTEKILFGANPATSYGLVGGRAFVEDSQAGDTCDFLSAAADSGQYRLTTATAAGSYTNTDFHSVTAGSVVKITGTPPAINDTSVYALNVSSGVVTINPGRSLTVSGGGIILSNGTITGGAVPFGASPVAIYAGPSSPSTIAAAISGTGGLVKLGPGQLILSGNNTLPGDLTIAGGTLSLGSTGAAGSAGFNNVAFLPGGGATLQLNGNSLTAAAINAAGADSVIENASALGGRLTVNNSASQAITTFSGILRDGAGGGAFSICKDGEGTLALKPASAEAYTGTTEIKAGELWLDYTNASAPATDLINSQSALVMGGSGFPVTSQFGPTLMVLGKSSGTTSQRFNGLTLKSGLAVISMDPNTQGTVEVHLGGMARSAGGAVDFGNNDGAGIYTTAVNDGSTGAATSTGILGGYAVVGNDWAVGRTDGMPVAAYDDYVVTAPPTAGTNANNYAIISNPGALTNNLTVNSLKITGGTAIDLGSKTLGLTSGGLLVTASSYSINNGQLGANDQEMIIWKSGGGTLTINARISNSGGSLTVAGEGTVKVTSVIPDTVNIARGTLELAPTSDYTYSGTIQSMGTLIKSGNSALILSGTSSIPTATVRAGAIVVPAAGSLHFGSGLTVSEMSGDTGSMSIAGGSVTCDGNLLVGGNSSGSLSISQGSLVTSGLQFGYTGGSPNQTSSVSISGGNVTVQDNLRVGSDNGTADLSISAGAATARYLLMGATSSLSVSGGTLAIGSVSSVSAIAGSVNISAGALFAGSAMTIGGYDPTSTNTVNLSGGLLSVSGGISHGAGSGTATFDFNGGTLQAGSSTTTFMQGLDHAYVQAGGAIIDTNGKNATIAQNLEAASPHGGLTKTGAGTLLLSGSNSYSGDTIVNGGTLKALAISSTANTTVAAGAVLRANYIKQHQVSLGIGAKVILGGVSAAGAPTNLAANLPSGGARSGSYATISAGAAAVPEPSTWVLLASGGCALLPLLRRRKRRSV